jgi:hypothetical protein
MFLADGTLRGISCLRRAPECVPTESKLKEGERSVLMKIKDDGSKDLLVWVLQLVCDEIEVIPASKSKQAGVESKGDRSRVVVSCKRFFKVFRVTYQHIFKIYKTLLKRHFVLVFKLMNMYSNK